MNKCSPTYQLHNWLLSRVHMYSRGDFQTCPEFSWEQPDHFPVALASCLMEVELSQKASSFFGESPCVCPCCAFFLHVCTAVHLQYARYHSNGRQQRSVTPKLLPLLSHQCARLLQRDHWMQVLCFLHSSNPSPVLPLDELVKVLKALGKWQTLEAPIIFHVVGQERVGSCRQNSEQRASLPSLKLVALLFPPCQQIVLAVL